MSASTEALFLPRGLGRGSSEHLPTASRRHFRLAASLLSASPPTRESKTKPIGIYRRRKMAENVNEPQKVRRSHHATLHGTAAVRCPRSCTSPRPRHARAPPNANAHGKGIRLPYKCRIAQGQKPATKLHSSFTTRTNTYERNRQQRSTREGQHLVHVHTRLILMLARWNAYRAHRHGSESPYAESTPGLNPCNHLA